MTAIRPLRIGTRGSALALVQANLVADALAGRDIEHEVVIVETAGDRRAPDTAWGEGAFVTAIEQSLVTGAVDIAVHSAKDVPTDEDPRLTIAAFLPREEPRDALVLPAGQTGKLATLPAGTIVGTDSPRRTGFLRAHRPDLEVRPLHGNVDTRLRRLDEQAVGALVLAAAGLIRLGRGDRISELLEPDVVPPAPGQGAIAVQVRADDALARQLVAGIDHAPTRHAVEAERAFLNATGGGCRAPIGAWSLIDADMLELHGGFATLDGRGAQIHAVTGPVAERLALAEALALQVVAARAHLPGTARVLVTRPEADSAQLIARLAEHGIASAVVPAIEIELVGQSAAVQQAFDAADFDWIVITSANAARALANGPDYANLASSSARWAAVGRASARELMRGGIRDVWVPGEANAAALARELPLEPGDRVLWPHGELADPGLSDVLTKRGARVSGLIAYRTQVGPDSSRAALNDALARGRIDGVILASPSAVGGLINIAAERAAEVRAIPAVCIGQRTADAATAAGFVVVAIAADPGASAVAEATAQAALAQHRQEAGVFA